MNEQNFEVFKEDVEKLNNLLNDTDGQGCFTYWMVLNNLMEKIIINYSGK